MLKSFKLITVTLIFILIFSTMAGAINLKDVSKDHWAYESVKRLVEKGYLTLYEDGTFSGEKKVTRYELAVMIARILDNIEQGKAEADVQDIETLRKLSLEFRDELVDVAKRQDIFTKSLEELQKKVNIIQNEDITQIHEKVNGIDSKVNSLDNKVDSISELNSSINANENEIEKIIDNIIKVKNLEEEVEDLKAQLNTMEEEIATTNMKIEEKNKTIDELKENMNKDINQQIEDQHAVTTTRIQSLQNRIKKLEDKLATYNKVDNKKEPNKLEGNSAVYLGAAALIILLAGMN